MDYLSRLTFCFDLDGTLVDTAPDLVRVLNTIIAKEGLPETNFKAARKAISRGSRVLIDEACDRANHSISEDRLNDLQKEFLSIYAETVAEKSLPYAGVCDVLNQLQSCGARLNVCTNKPGYLARPLLEELGMAGYFDRVVGGDDVLNKKPNPDHIFATAGHYDAPNIVMVGDSYTDMRAAHNAKVPAVLVTYGYSVISPLKLKADCRIGNFRALLPALNKVFA